jgi:hypothetical protein
MNAPDRFPKVVPIIPGDIRVNFHGLRGRRTVCPGFPSKGLKKTVKYQVSTVTNSLFYKDMHGGSGLK